jgi:hypothetical protein
MRPEFFVFGVKRSGTTLLSALLTEHPDVCVVNDSGIYRAFNRSVMPVRQRILSKALAKGGRSSRSFARAEASHLPSGSSRVTLADVDRYFMALMDRYRPRNSGGWMVPYAARLDFSPMLAPAREGTLSLQQMFEMAYWQLVPDDQKGKRLFGEKTPNHLYLCDWIARNNPDARMVTLVREPITNVAAIYKRDYAGNLTTAISMYLSFYIRQFDMLYEGHGRSLVIRYEDLIRRPEMVLTRVYRHLGVEAIPVKGDFNYGIRTSYVGGEIDTDRDRKLRELLDPRQREMVGRRCRMVYERFYSDADCDDRQAAISP